MKRCEVCGREVNRLKRGMCPKHYNQFLKHGHCLDNNPRTICDPNEIIKYDDYAEIILYDKNNEEKTRALIDIEDIDKVKNYKWGMDSYGYVRGGSTKKIQLHRLIMDCPKDMCVDHINLNPLDNRKSNLRICTKHQNEMNVGIRNHNTSGITGVGYHKEANKWRAYIQYNNKFIHLGLYNTKEEAIKSRKEAEIKYFGEYRNKNN